MADRTPLQFRIDVARRVWVARQALGKNQSVFGAAAGVGQSTVANWEKSDGLRMLGPYYAVKLAKKYALTLEYFYDGDVSRLPPDLRDEIIKKSEENGWERVRAQVAPPDASEARRTRRKA